MRSAAIGHQVEKIFLNRQAHQLLHGMQRMQHVRQTLPAKRTMPPGGGKMIAADVIVMATPSTSTPWRADEDTD